MSPPRGRNVAPLGGLMTITSESERLNSPETRSNPYLYQNYIDGIVKRMDEKFDTLGGLTRDFEHNQGDLLLFKNKLYRIISDVQNDLRESANLIHLLTQDRVRLQEQVRHLELDREQRLENHQRLRERSDRLEGKVEGLLAELEYYRSECERLKAGDPARRPEADALTRREISELMAGDSREEDQTRRILGDSVLTHRSSALPYTSRESTRESRLSRTERLIADLLQLTEGERESGLRAILQQPFSSLEQLRGALERYGESQEAQDSPELLATVTLLLKLVMARGAEDGQLKTVGTSPFKFQSGPVLGISPQVGSLRSLGEAAGDGGAFQNESEIVRSQSRSMSQWDSPFKQQQTTSDEQKQLTPELCSRGEEGLAKWMSMNFAELKELVKQEVLAEIKQDKGPAGAGGSGGGMAMAMGMGMGMVPPPPPLYHRLQGESGEVSFHSSYNFEKTATLPQPEEGKDAPRRLTPSSSENDMNIKVKTTSELSDMSEEPGTFLPVEYEEFDPGSLPTGGTEKRVTEYDSAGSNERASTALGQAGLQGAGRYEASVISEKTESEGEGLVEDAPVPLEAGGAGGRSLKGSEPPSEASKVEDYVETHIMAVRTGTSPPMKSLPLEPSKELRAEMLITGEDSDASMEERPRTSLPQRRSEGPSPPVRTPLETSGASEDLLGDLKKEDWPSNMLESQADSFSEGGGDPSFSKTTSVLKIASVAEIGGQVAGNVIHEGPEEEEAGTPLRKRSEDVDVPP